MLSWHWKHLSLQLLHISSFYRWENWGWERWKDLPLFSLLNGNRGKTRTWASLLSSNSLTPELVAFCVITDSESSPQYLSWVIHALLFSTNSSVLSWISLYLLHKLLAINIFWIKQKYLFSRICRVPVDFYQLISLVCPSSLSGFHAGLWVSSLCLLSCCVETTTGHLYLHCLVQL